MAKFSLLKKVGLAALLALPSLGVAADHQYEIGTYIWTITPITDIKGTTSGSTVQLGVKVLSDEPLENISDSGTLYLVEAEGDTYFHGYAIPMEYHGGGYVIFTSQEKVEVGSNLLYFAPCYLDSGYGMCMPVNNENYSFTPEDGFTAPKSNVGLAFYTTSGNSGTTPMDWYSGFYFESSTGNQGGSSDPGIAEGTIGTYVWTITPVNQDYKKTEYTSVRLEVTYEGESDNGNYTFYLSEKGDNTYFQGTSIPFTYNPEDETATFDATIIETSGENLYFSVFALGEFPEPQPQYPFDFSIEEGFSTDKENIGFGWYTLDEDGENPEAYDFGFLIGEYEADPVAPGKEYPSLSEFNGDYKFTGTFTWGENCEDLAALCASNDPEFVFPEEAEFALNTTVNNATFELFFGNPNMTAIMTYDQTTGKLTFSNANIGSIVDYTDYTNYNFGVADKEGNWNGVTNPTAYWQVEEDGTITIPDFTIVNYNVTPAQIVGYYTNCKLEETSIEPSITILSAVVDPDDDEVVVRVAIGLTNIEESDIAGAFITFIEGTNDFDIDATYSESTNTVTAVLTELEDGTYSYEISVTLLGEDDEVIAVSEITTIDFKYTGIEGLNAINPTEGVYYNLQGIRVANPQKGIFILNGKKVLVK